MAFYPCTNNEIDSLINGTITSINSAVTTLKINAFNACVNLVDVNLPNITSIPVNAFAACSSLPMLDFEQNIISFGNSCFNGCSALNTIVLRGDTVTGIVSTNVFNNTPFASDGNGGILYVPQALIASYQAHPVWSTILGYPNNQILAIEGSPYEN